jgi:hypothetical protein
MLGCLGAGLGMLVLPEEAHAKSPASRAKARNLEYIETDEGCCFVMPDPEAVFSPYARKNPYAEPTNPYAKLVSLALLQKFVEEVFEQKGFNWSDFGWVHIQLFRDGHDWTNGMSRPQFVVNQLQRTNWNVIRRAIQIAYNQVRAPYRIAFMDKIAKGETRFSAANPPPILIEKFTEDEARELGFLIPPHDEVRLLFKRQKV